MGTTRVGHTGTLDKFAEGLLIALSGSYTRLAEIFLNLHKSYKAVICLGKETSTLDPEGEIIAEGDVPSGERIHAVLKTFSGNISQVPPRYSAVHVNGKRAYKYAMQGTHVELAARPVTIFRIASEDYTPPLLTLDITCSRGTYIRALARDIAREMGTCGYVTGLKRYGIGPFMLSEAVRPDEFRPELHLKPAFTCLKRLDRIRCVTVEHDVCAKVRSGAKLDDYFLGLENAQAGLYALFTPGKELLAVVSKKLNTYGYKMVVKE
jgi:tRNA pseudouridine55 synthase